MVARSEFIGKVHGTPKDAALDEALMPGMTGGERRLNCAPRYFAVTRLNEAQPGGGGGRLSPVFHVELTQNIPDVGFHRVFRDR